MTATELPAVRVGAGSSVHVAYLVGGTITGTLCSRAAWDRGGRRVRVVDEAPTCRRCAAAVRRSAEAAGS